MSGKFFLFDYQIGDIVTMKKKHPVCGSDRWTVEKTGAEIKLTCLNCGRQMQMRREALEKATVKVDRA